MLVGDAWNKVSDTDAAPRILLGRRNFSACDGIRVTKNYVDEPPAGRYAAGSAQQWPRWSQRV